MSDKNYKNTSNNVIIAPIPLYKFNMNNEYIQSYVGTELFTLYDEFILPNNYTSSITHIGENISNMEEIDQILINRPSHPPPIYPLDYDSNQQIFHKNNDNLFDKYKTITDSDTTINITLPLSNSKEFVTKFCINNTIELLNSLCPIKLFLKSDKEPFYIYFANITKVTTKKDTINDYNFVNMLICYVKNLLNDNCHSVFKLYNINGILNQNKIILNDIDNLSFIRYRSLNGKYIKINKLLTPTCIRGESLLTINERYLYYPEKDLYVIKKSNYELMPQ